MFDAVMAEAPAGGAPVVVRIANALPDLHRGFGLNCLTTHLMGAHVEDRSDGFPDDPPEVTAYRPVTEPGKHFDYLYPFRDAGHATGAADQAERPSTLVYRDNLLDFAAPNVYRGLTGLFRVFDEVDAGDETGARHPETNLRLPSGPYDEPLVLQDVRLGDGGRLCYAASERDGALGDRFLVNGRLQPHFQVARRKYRFRVVNASIARLYALQLADTAGRSLRFDHLIATGGGLLARRIPGLDHLLLAAGERREVVIDFARFPDGARLELVDRLDQKDARGPDGTVDAPVFAGPEQRRTLLKFVVRDDGRPDPSRIPEVLRPQTAWSEADLGRAERRGFEFARRNGVWSINRAVVDIDVPLATLRLDAPEIWTLANPTDWWLPIRISRAFFRVRSRNGRQPLAHEVDGVGRSDCVVLAPGDRVEVGVRFRDYPGRVVLSSGNLTLTDAFLRARFDVL
jgi:FtsP/CotA-like multicopper oxidase with cupredoxin domain